METVTFKTQIPGKVWLKIIDKWDIPKEQVRLNGLFCGYIDFKVTPNFKETLKHLVIGVHSYDSVIVDLMKEKSDNAKSSS